MIIDIDDMFFYKKAKWKLEFAWIPTQCAISKKLIWLETGYKGVVKWNQLVDMGMNKLVLTETRWITKQQFIFGKIKGTI